MSIVNKEQIAQELDAELHRAPDFDPAQLPEWAGNGVETDFALSKPPEHGYTPLWAAQNFARLHASHLCYCFSWKSWHYFEGRRWIRDEIGEVPRLVKDFVISLRAHAASLDAAQRGKFLNFVRNSETKNRLNEIADLAASEPGIYVTPDSFDADGLKLNVLNGTLDLRSYKLYQHNSADLITKLVNIEYNQGVESPMFLAFLDKIFNDDKELIAFIQRAVGYTLTGDTSEQVMFVLYGTGANGKSTFVSILTELLGDYAGYAPPEMLLAKRSDRIPSDLARLQHSRLAVVSETGEGRSLDEALVKQITGGDKITARHLYQDFFEYDPKFKLWLPTNHKPNIRGNDHAIWRRILLLPFNVTIGKAERDPRILSRLLKELPGILNWALEGCRLWQLDHLIPPETVLRATRQYRVESDVYGRFLEECCISDSEAVEPVSKLWQRFESWCEQSGERSGTKQRFGSYLKSRGFESVRGSRGIRGWKGLRLIEHE